MGIQINLKAIKAQNITKCKRWYNVVMSREDAVMSDVVIPAEAVISIEKVIVTAEEYMEKYADKHVEWVNGEVVVMAPIEDVHNSLSGYLYMLILGYLEMNPIGIVRYDPFVMKLETMKAYRQPDLQIILGDNLKNLTPTAMIGAADICIEVVSVASIGTDYDIKFGEYEKGGVKEYWIIDPKRRVVNFHRLNENGVYEAINATDNRYTTLLLPQFVFDTTILWRDKLPATLETGDIIRTMFKE
jgi:Uma2 family endonuclease